MQLEGTSGQDKGRVIVALSKIKLRKSIFLDFDMPDDFQTLFIEK